MVDDQNPGTGSNGTAGYALQLQLLSAEQRDFWWYFLSVTSSYMLVCAVLRPLYVLFNSKAIDRMGSWTRMGKDATCILLIVLDHTQVRKKEMSTVYYLTDTREY